MVQDHPLREKQIGGVASTLWGVPESTLRFLPAAEHVLENIAAYRAATLVDLGCRNAIFHAHGYLESGTVDRSYIVFRL